jgi:F-type H+-transporting ATPase subunit b
VSINATLIGQIMTFALLVWFTMKYIWPPLFYALEERKKKIAEGLAAGERGQEEMLLAEKKAKGLLKTAKDQSSEIVTLAQKQANEIVEASKSAAKKEGDRLILAAKAQIDQEVQQSKDSLRKEIAALAVSAAEQILTAEIDKTKHQEIVDKISKKL